MREWDEPVARLIRDRAGRRRWTDCEWELAADLRALGVGQAGSVRVA